MQSVRMSRGLGVAALLWIGLVLALGATGALAGLKPPAPQLIILGVTLALIAATTALPALRDWVDALALRTLVGFHAVRFVGVVFLVLSARGALSPVFAMRAGWGDIAAAAFAVVLVVTGAPTTPARRWAYQAWNAFGMLDLVVAVGTATMVTFRGDVPGVQPLLQLPLVLVPLFFVPVLFASHVAILRRLSAKAVPALA